jgi:hypothetical protein
MNVYEYADLVYEVAIPMTFGADKLVTLPQTFQ